MKISKYLTNPSHIFKSLKTFGVYVDSLKPKYFRATFSMIDEKIEFESVEEFHIHNHNHNHIIYNKDFDKDVKSFTLKCIVENGLEFWFYYSVSDGNAVLVKVTAKSPGDIQGVLDELGKIFSQSDVYKYKRSEEDVEGVTEKRNELKNLLSNYDQFISRDKPHFSNEVDFQKFLFPILKSHFLDLVYEDPTNVTAGNFSKIDFGIPSGRIILEAKYIRKPADFKKIKTELLQDAFDYIQGTTGYDCIIAIIYNSNAALSVPNNYIQDLMKHQNIYDIQIVR